jgi:hypothetical protein
MKMLTQKDKNHLIVVNGIAIIMNHLVYGDWFIFGKSRATGNDVTVHGPLADMKKLAKFAAAHKTLSQDNYGNGSIQEIVDYAKSIKNKSAWSE